MKTPGATQAALRAIDRVQFNAPPKFTPRQMRALWALWNGPVMREVLDRAAGCSNSPQLVTALNAKGVEIKCTLIDKIDRDGNKCRSGRYELTDKGRETLWGWGWGMVQ